MNTGMNTGCPFVQADVDPATVPVYNEKCCANSSFVKDLLEFVYEKIRASGRQMCGSAFSYEPFLDDGHRVYYLSSLENAIVFSPCCSTNDHSL